jgi:hypothetical protein
MWRVWFNEYGKLRKLTKDEKQTTGVLVFIHYAVSNPPEFFDNWHRSDFFTHPKVKWGGPVNFNEVKILDTSPKFETIGGTWAEPYEILCRRENGEWYIETRIGYWKDGEIIQEYVLNSKKAEAGN